MAAAIALPSSGVGLESVDSAAGLRQLRFSSDGRYVLAQDDVEVTVLTVQPFAVLFRIRAEDTTDAQFTPDSQQIVFVSAVTRVSRQKVTYVHSAAHAERWSIADKTRVGYQEVPAPGCGTAALSPDGRVFVCNDFEGTLWIADVDSARIVLQQRQFIKLVPVYNVIPGIGEELPNGHFLGDLGRASMDFSPDAHFLVAVPSGGQGQTIAYDVRNRTTVALRQGLGWLRSANVNAVIFAFVARDQILMTRHWFAEARHGVKTGRLVAFPSGKVLAKPRVPPGTFFRAADPSYAIVRPFGSLAGYRESKRAAAVNLHTGQVIISETPALDVFGGNYVTEPSPGVVGLYQRGKGLQATVVLHNK